MKNLIASVSFLATGALLHATPLFYDSFNYGPSGTSLGTAATGIWAKNGASPDPTVQNVGGLTYPGLLVSADTVSLQYDGSGVNQGSGAPAATDGTTISSGGITTGSLYYSLLMKVTAVQVGTGGNGYATGGNLTSGSFMAGLQTINSNQAPVAGSSAAPLLIRSGDGTQFSSTFQLGTARTATAGDRQWVLTQFNTGDTVFVVLKYNFDSVNGDSASLFLNPTPGSSEPAAQLTVTGGTPLTLNTGIKSFFVRNNSVEPDALLIDELRIGTTWEDVTPSSVPEPATGLILGVATLGLILIRRFRG